MLPLSDAGASYRAWHAAAGVWQGYCRVVPLVALARGASRPPGGVTATARRAARALAEQMVAVGEAERWLGQPDVLVVLDLLGAESVLVASELAAHNVRPVLLLLHWPGPRAIVPSA